jgi:enediyne biosynthesis protein E4
VRPIVAALLLALALAACRGANDGSTSSSPSPTPASTPAPPFPGVAFEEIARRIPALEITQVGGDPAVDYIIDSIGAGAAWLDYDADGDPDLYLAQGATRASPTAGPPDRLLRNDGDPDRDGVPAFTDVTTSAGLGDTLWSFGVSVADYDGDGDSDIYLLNWGPNRLYRNDGSGTFTEIGKAAGVDDPRFSVSATWGDADGDGDLDLYVANYVEFDFARYPARGQRGPNGAPPCTWKGLAVFCGPRNLAPADGAYFRNDGDADGDGVPTFTDATREAGLVPDEPRYALGARFFDADGDGDEDLYVTNDSLQNVFFVNQGNGKFREGAILAGLAYNDQGHEQASMGIAIGDYNNDLRLDVAVTNFSHDHETLYRNDGYNLFTDVSFPAGIGSPSWFYLGWGLAFADVDHDGFEDLIAAYGHVYPQVDERDVGTSYRQRNGLYRNRGDGTFEEISARAGSGFAVVKSSRALAPVDLDADGDLDFLVTNLNDTPDLLRNDGAKGAWLEVALAGRGKNRDGIGARVTVEAGGRSQMREIRRDLGFAASTLPIAHFGLGAATVVDRVEVRWPSGRTTRAEAVRANERLTIKEPPHP